MHCSGTTGLTRLGQTKEYLNLRVLSAGVLAPTALETDECLQPHQSGDTREKADSRVIKDTSEQ